MSKPWSPFVTRNLKYIVQPGTDVSGIKMQTRTCKCGCKRTFRVLESSKQEYAAEGCKGTKDLDDLTSKEKQTRAWVAQEKASFSAMNEKKRGRTA